jgi:TolB-like protein/Flp pilus assembly protein TadD
VSLFDELKRRNVFRVGIAYAVGAWLLLQLTDVLSELLELPSQVGPVVVAIVLIGFPVVLFAAWAYELTPDGIRRDAEVRREDSIARETGRKLNLATIAMLLGVGALVVYDRLVPETAETAETAAGVAAAAVPDAQPTSAETLATGIPPEASVPARDETPSVAVLPFANMSPDPDNEYFSDGISEELLNLLVRVEGLRVPSRTSSFAFKNQNTDIREIARQLEVAHILEGSVRKAGNRVRITAQLIDVSTDSHLWSETYDRELEDIFAIQDEIASEIVGALQGVLGTAVAHERPTDSLEAYNLYLQGLFLFQQRGRSLTEAERLLRRAVALDPEFVEAWATLGLTLIMQPNYEDRPVEEAVPLALEAADRVDALRPDMAEALMVRGNAEGKSGRYASAMREYQHAVDLHPEHSLARLWYAITLLNGGYLVEAERHLLVAQSLDPASGLILDWLGRAQVMLGKPEPAAGNLERAVRFNRPQAIWGLGILALEGHLPPDRFAALAESADPVFRESARLSLSVNAGELPLDVARSRLDEIFQDPRAADYGRFVLSSYTGDQAGMIELLPVIWPRDTTTLSTLWYGNFAVSRNDPRIRAELERIRMVDLWRERGWPDLCRPAGDDDYECD